MAASVPVAVGGGMDGDEDAGPPRGNVGSAADTQLPALVLPVPDKPGPYEVVMEQNVGAGFENVVNIYDYPGSTYCTTFALSFGLEGNQLKTFSELPADLDMALFTMYRPKQFEPGRLYPLLTWGNGSCAAPEAYGVMLRHIASHGFIVIAANTRFTAGAGPNAPMIHAIDWALKASSDPQSPLYQHIDITRIGSFGHAQGAGACWSAAADPRIRTSVMLNGSATGMGSRPVPTLFISGDRDIETMSSQRDYVDAQPSAAMLFFHMIPGDGAADGHLIVMTDPQRVVGPVTAWFRYQLNSDAVSRDWFVGATCKLCNRAPELDYLAKGLE